MREELSAKSHKAGRGAAPCAVVALAALALCCVAPRVAKAQASTPFLGEIIEVPYSYCPPGWIEPLGQTLMISQYNELWLVIGFTYGGDGQRTFQLPYLPPLTLSYGGVATGGLTVKHCLALQGVFPQPPAKH